MQWMQALRSTKKSRARTGYSGLPLSLAAQTITVLGVGPGASIVAVMLCRLSKQYKLE